MEGFKGKKQQVHRGKYVMIIYFSGTGNSYSVAKKLAAAIGDEAVPLIRLAENPDSYDLEKEDRIGIVFPVYYGDVPKPVEEFFKTVKLSQYTYFYGVATCGGSYGNSLCHLRGILKNRGCDLKYSKVSFMIANSTATWKKNVSYDYHKLDGENDLVREVARAVEQKQIDYSMTKSSIMGSILSSNLVKSIGMKRFIVSVDKDACVGCGLCIRICPSHNLDMKNGMAVVGDHCAFCMACVHTCPQGGMMVNGHAIRKENQYRHPEVELQEMFLRKGDVR